MRGATNSSAQKDPENATLSFTATDFSTYAYVVQKSGNNVSLSIYFQDANGHSPSVLFTLPEGYRPPELIRVPIIGLDAAPRNVIGYINASGEIGNYWSIAAGCHYFITMSYIIKGGGRKLSLLRRLFRGRRS